MKISERILLTITKIANRDHKKEDDVTWNEIAIELTAEINKLTKQTLK